MEITITNQPATFQSKNNRIKIHFNTAFNSSEKNISLLIFHQDKYVGGLFEEGGISSGVSEIELSFNGYLSGQKDITVQLQRIVDGVNEELYKTTFSIQVEGLILNEYLKYTPHAELEWLSSKLSKSIYPEINIGLLTYFTKGKRKKHYSHTHAGVTNKIEFKLCINDIDETEFVESNNIDSFSLRPFHSLVEGENHIRLEIFFPDYEFSTQVLRGIITVDTHAPILKFIKPTIYSNNFYPEFSFEVEDLNSGVNTDSLQFLLNNEKVKVKLVSKETTEKKMILTYHLYKKIWEGKHILSATIADNCGNHSLPTECVIIIDTSPPEINNSYPSIGGFLNENDYTIEINFKSKNWSSASQHDVKDMMGVGGRNLYAYKELNVTRIGDLANLGDVLSQRIPRRTLTRNIEKAKLIARTIINPNEYRELLPMKVKEIIESDIKEITLKTGINKSKLLELKEYLRPLYICLDISPLRKLRLGELALIEDVGVEMVSFVLDGEILTEDSSINNNRVSCKINRDLEHGAHNLSVLYTDKCGNSSEEKITFYVDKVGPVITDVYPEENDFVNNVPLTFRAKYNDLYSGINPQSTVVLLDEVDITGDCKVTSTGISYTRTQIAEGAHNFVIKVSDLAGNETAHTSHFQYDITPPSAFLDDIQNLIATKRNNLSISGHVSEQGLSVNIQGHEAVIDDDLTFIITVPLVEGLNVITGSVTDKSDNSSLTNSLKIFRLTVQSSAVFGRVLDQNRNPVAGVKVFVRKSESWTFTDLNGKFCLYNLPLQTGVNKVEFLPLADNGFPAFSRELIIQNFSELNLGNIFLLPPENISGQEIITDNDGYTTVQEAGVDEDISLSIPNKNIIFPEGRLNKISISKMNIEQIPVPLPDNINAESIILLEPSGLKLKDNTDSKIGINFQNTQNIEPETILPLLTLSLDKGKWELGGFAKVTADGKSIMTMPNKGIRHFSMVAPIMPMPRIEILNEDRHIPGGDALKGGAIVNIELPGFEFMGNQVSPTLTYNSLTAAPTVLATGIFRGIEEIKSVEELEPYTITDSKTLMHATGHYAARLYRDMTALDFFYTLGMASFHKYELTEFAHIENDINTYLPMGFNPYSTESGREDIEGGWVETVNKVVQEPVQVYKFIKEISQNVTSILWPRAISSKYYFGYIETKWNKIFGKPTRKVVNGIEKDSYVLPANIALTQKIIPKFSSGQYYPTGLYYFIGNYNVEYEGYSNSKVSALLKDFSVDKGFLNYQKKKKGDLLVLSGLGEADIIKINQMHLQQSYTTTEQESDVIETKIRQLISASALNPAQQDELINYCQTVANFERMADVFSHQLPTTVQDKTAWLDPMDVFSKSESGAVILHNLSNSSFGRGWAYKDIQHLYPVGDKKALIIHGEEKLVFSSSYNTMHDLCSFNKEEFQLGNTFAQDPSNKNIHYTSNEGAIFKLNSSLHKAEVFINLDKHSEKVTEIKNEKVLLRKKRIVGRVYKLKERNKLLPPNKWRIVWRGFSSYLHTREDYYGYVNVEEWYSYWDGTWKNTNTLIDEKITEKLFHINAIAVGNNGEIYCADNNHQILKILDNTQTVICGDYSKHINVVNKFKGNFKTEITRETWEVNTLFSMDGLLAIGSSINNPSALLIDDENNLIFSEKGSHRIRKINFKTGQLETVAGNGFLDYSPYSIVASQAAMPNPGPLCKDSKGNIFCLLTYSLNNLESQILVKIDSNGYQTQIAGNPLGTTSTGIKAILHKLVDASSISADQNDNLFIYENNRILIIDANGFIEEYAGGSMVKPDGVNSAALNMDIGHNGILQILSDDELIFMDPENNAIRTVTSSILNQGPAYLRGPSGYYESKLEKKLDGTWIRKYKNGDKVLFDSFGKQLNKIDRNFNKTKYLYKSDDSLEQITYPFGQYLKFEYDNNGMLTSITDHLNRKSTFSIESSTLNKITLPNSDAIEFEYDEEGKLLTKKEM